MEKNRWMSLRPHFGEAVAHGDVFEVAWYMVQGAGTGRKLGVRGTIDRATGAMQLRSGFFRLPASSTA
jgi:hypothetical protein